MTREDKKTVRLRRRRLKLIYAILNEPTLFVFALIVGVLLGVMLSYASWKIAKGIDIYDELFIRSRRRTPEDE